jgi:hypothetical protein
LLRTTTNVFSCQAISHIVDAFNGKLVDWLPLFRETIVTELKSLKEELFKDKTTMLKTMLGPPLTMMLIIEGLLSVQQEIEAGILMPPDFIDKPVSKKRKMEQATKLTIGGTSKQKEKLQILVALAEPAMAKPMKGPNNDRRSENSAHLKPYSFTQQETSKILAAAMVPTTNKTVLINTRENDTS